MLWGCGCLQKKGNFSERVSVGVRGCMGVNRIRVILVRRLMCGWGGGLGCKQTRVTLVKGLVWV